MIEFYTAATPNVRKVTIMLEELGLKYNAHPMDLSKNEQKSPAYIRINPNGRVPAIVDTAAEFGRATPVFESGAILIYLAEKERKFMGTTAFDRAQVMGWLMFQMSAVGPNFGNFSFGKTNNIPALMERFQKESLRIISVMNTQLAEHTYLAGDFYSIADMATYPWVAAFMKNRPEWFEMAPSVRRWAQLVGERPAVKKAMG